MTRQQILSPTFHSYAPPYAHSHDPVASYAPLQAATLRPAAAATEYLPADHFPAPPPQAHHYIPRQPPQPINMSYVRSDEELAELQKLSQDYRPEYSVSPSPRYEFGSYANTAEGPLVSEKQSSSSVTTEYANADPVYRAKTAALPQTHPYIRTCRGDGNCGWRAIALAYFEQLLRRGDPSKFHEEAARLQSFDNILRAVGYEKHLYEDFAEAAWDLLNNTALAIGMPNAEAELLNTFNDYSASMEIITYFKILTSAWIQTHPGDYQPFLPGEPVDNYCRSKIDPTGQEIEHIGLTALYEVLLKQAGIAMEIIYLDRTPGAEANVHQYTPNMATIPQGTETPSISLLYRPGHYDILYKAEPPPPRMMPSSSMSNNLSVNLVSSASEYYHMPVGGPGHSMGSMGALAMLPGFSSPCLMGMGSQSFAPSSTDMFAATPATGLHVDTMSPYGMQPVAAIPPEPQYASNFTPVDITPTIPVETPRIERGGPFRHSAWQLEPELNMTTCATNFFQTSVFRNSHYNQAHFLNSDFQPEQWTPNDEITTTSRGRQKSSSS